MKQCNYWLTDNADQWCDLAIGTCNCNGNGVKCSLTRDDIKTALHKVDALPGKEAMHHTRRFQSDHEVN